MPRVTQTRRLPDTFASRELLCVPGRDWSCNLKIERKARTEKGSMFERNRILDNHCLIVKTLMISCFNGYWKLGTSSCRSNVKCYPKDSIGTDPASKATVSSIGGMVAEVSEAPLAIPMVDEVN